MTKTSIQYIKEAAKKLVNSKLQRLGAAKTQEIFKGVMQTVGLETIEEVYLFVAQFDLTCRDSICNMDDLARYFECSSLDMIEYVPALKSLESKGLLVRRGRREPNIMRQYYAVSDVVMAAVIENKSVCINSVEVNKVEIDKYEFCKRIAENIEDSNVVTEELVLFTGKMEKDNTNLAFVKTLQRDVKDILDRILFYDLCYDSYEHDGVGSSDISRTSKDIFSNMGQRILVKKAINEQEHILMQLGLIEIDEDDHDYMRLTDKGKNISMVTISKLSANHSSVGTYMLS